MMEYDLVVLIREGLMYCCGMSLDKAQEAAEYITKMAYDADWLVATKPNGKYRVFEVQPWEGGE